MPKKLTLRGASIRQFQMFTKNNTSFVRITFKCDITPAIAEDMGWEIYHEGTTDLIAGLKKSTPLTGELLASNMVLSANPGGPDTLDCRASLIEDFKLSRKGKDDENVETYLWFTVESPDWMETASAFSLWGDVTGLLKVTLASKKAEIQPTLEEQPGLELEDKQETNGAPRKRRAPPAPAKATMQRV